MTNLHVRVSALDHKWHIKEVLFFKAFDFLTVWIEIFIGTGLLRNCRKTWKISVSLQIYEDEMSVIFDLNFISWFVMKKMAAKIPDWKS